MEGLPFTKNYNFRTSLVAQWLGLHVSTAGGMVLITGGGTGIPQDIERQKKKTNSNFIQDSPYIHLQANLQSCTPTESLKESSQTRPFMCCFKPVLGTFLPFPMSQSPMQGSPCRSYCISLSDSPQDPFPRDNSNHSPCPSPKLQDLLRASLF